MRILWDKDKARINEEKHGVTFEEAAEVLSGDYIEFESNANGEKRSRAVTRIRGEYLTVVYARRDKEDHLSPPLLAKRKASV